MSTTPSIRATPPAKAIAAMARKTTPDEIAEVTGWDIKAVRAAIRAGELPGCRFVPSGVSATSGSYLCAWAPFVRWFRDGVEPAAAPKDETQRFLHHIKTLDTIQNLIESEAVS